MSSENKKNAHLHLQKSLEISDTNSADKIQSLNNKGVKVTCLMPIRVKYVVIECRNNGHFFEERNHTNIPIKYVQVF